MKASEAKSLVDAALQPYRALEQARVVFEELEAAEQNIDDTRKQIVSVKKELVQAQEKLDGVKHSYEEGERETKHILERANEEAARVIAQANTDAAAKLKASDAKNKGLMAEYDELVAAVEAKEKELATVKASVEEYEAKITKQKEALSVALSNLG